MKFLAPLALLLIQGVLAAPVPEPGHNGCCKKETPHCPEKPECECPVCLTGSPLPPSPPYPPSTSKCHCAFLTVNDAL